MAVGSIQESFKSVFYLFVLCAFDGEAVHAVGCVWRSEEDFESSLFFTLWSWGFKSGHWSGQQASQQAVQHLLNHVIGLCPQEGFMEAD